MKAKLTTRSVSASTPRSKYFKMWDTLLTGFFLRVLPSGVKTYCIYYRHKGVGREYTIGKHGKITADQARKQAKIKLGEIAKGKDIQTEKKIASVQSKVKKYQTLGGFIEAKYKPWVLTERKSGKDIIRNLSKYFGHLFSRAIVDISPWDVQKWRTEKIKQGLKPSTVNRQLVNLKACINKALEWEVIDKHPLAKVKPLKVDTKGKIRYLSDDEETRLRNSLDDR